MVMRSPLLLLWAFAVVLGVALEGAEGWRGRKVGGRTEVRNVEGNEEVQRLGAFAVEEYNGRMRGRGEPRLLFANVVEAQRQVVAGIKYYLDLEVEGRRSNGKQLYEAVVVVKPWKGSRELISFAPIIPPTGVAASS